MHRRQLMASRDWTEAELKLVADESIPAATVAKRLGRTADSVSGKRTRLRGGATTSAPNIVGPTTEIIKEFQRDNAVLTSKSPAVRTLDDLLHEANVDLTVWEVERHVVNQWQSARKDRDMKLIYNAGAATGYIDDRGGMHIEPLWQVKAWLRRRTPVETSLAGLLRDIRTGAPMLPQVKRPKARKGQARRSLEICIMDAHLGLLCGMPEADAPWDLDLAAGTIMQALDDLIAKAEPFGPFDEVFMPFGNDFVHSDNVFHTTTAGTAQPEAISWHRVYDYAERVAIGIVERARQVAPVSVYEVPGNHSRMADFTLARLLKARFHGDKDVMVDASSSPYKFHRFGVNLIGYEHGHSVSPIRLAALMANERPTDFAEAKYREWHLGDQHRKGSSNPAAFEEQGVSIEYMPGIVAPNEWHRLKGFNHQQRGAVAIVWDAETGPFAKLYFNILKYAQPKAA